MLVLTRKPEELIVMKGHGFVILKLIRINGNVARLGFKAPRAFKIYRKEILSPQELSEFQLNGDDHHPNQPKQNLWLPDESLKVCS